jgi:hypothetical protein
MASSSLRVHARRSYVEPLSPPPLECLGMIGGERRGEEEVTGRGLPFKESGFLAGRGRRRGGNRQEEQSNREEDGDKTRAHRQAEERRSKEGEKKERRRRTDLSAADASLVVGVPSRYRVDSH